MKVVIHKTMLTDGFTSVHDVDVFPNTLPFVDEKRAIFTCKSKEDAFFFLKGLKALVERHTCDSLEVEEK